MADMDIDEVMERLHSGETLMIDDQWRSYISIEDDDTPRRFVMKSIPANVEDHYKGQAKPLADTMYTVQRFPSLAAALLSLTDYDWRRPPQS